MWPFGSSYCKSKARLVGKTVVITGANTGIGKETARDLYRRGARVILACRDITKANAAVEDIKSNPTRKPNKEQFRGEPGELIVHKLDLNSLSSVRECAKQINETESAIHILINNAGIMMCPKGLTEDGFETQFGVNHLGHFLFTLLLLPKIIRSRKDSDLCCRIVNVSSLAHWVPGTDINFRDLMSERSYNCIYAYSQSKLANVLFTRELARRLGEANISGVNTYSLHPGVIKSELSRHLDESFFRGLNMLYGLVSFLIKNVEQGAQTTLYCAIDESAERETGLYYDGCGKASMSFTARNDAKAVKLWEESIKLVGLSSANLKEIIDQVSEQYNK